MIRYKHGDVILHKLHIRNLNGKKIFLGISILIKISFYILINLINNI